MQPSEKKKPRKVTMKDELCNRIYDNGYNLMISFNLTTMPSVKRPETQASINRPLVAKLQTKTGHEEVIYSKQAVVLKSNKTLRASLKKSSDLKTIPETERMQSTDRFFFDADKQQKQDQQSIKKSIQLTGMINHATNHNFRR